MLSAETESFLRERILFEKTLNNYSYRNEVASGQLMSHSLNRWFRNQQFISFFGFLKNIVWIFYISFKKNMILSNRRLYLLPNNEERTKRLFNPIQDIEDNEYSQFTIINNFYKGSNWLCLFKSIYGILSSLPKFYKQLSLTKKQYPIKKPVTSLVFMYILQCLKYDIAKDKIKRIGVKSILVDLDRSVFGAPIVLAAKNLGITNATLVHGSVLPPFLYVPVIADNIFCWGEFHKTLFSSFSTNPVNYINSGSLASKKVVEKSYSIDLKNLTFVSQNFSSNEQYDVIKRLGKISKNLNEYGFNVSVKAHPADDYNRMFQICNESNIVLLDKKVTLEESINLTSVFLIISSTFVFDAIGAGCPVIFYDTNTGQSELSLLFKNQADALVVENENQLFDELVDFENQKTNYRFKKLKQFYTNYISNFSEESAKVVVNKLKESNKFV